MSMLVDNLMDLVDEIDDHGLGKISHSEDGHWVVGDDSHFPIQLEILSHIEQVIIYGTFVKNSGEPIYTPILSSMMLENMIGTTLTGYGICPGPVTFTIFSKVSTSTMTPPHLVELVSGIRQLIDYIRLSTSLSSEDADQMDKAETDRLLPTGQVH
ncbi:MAG: hypothetical protein ACO3TT_03960 [Candidatus Puniceispirillales bacterium]